jgi:hypothetical protein
MFPSPNFRLGYIPTCSIRVTESFAYKAFIKRFVQYLSHCLIPTPLLLYCLPCVNPERLRVLGQVTVENIGIASDRAVSSFALVVFKIDP